MSSSKSHPLLEILRKLEIELHQPHVRGNRDALAALLHPSFREFGRSGVTYTREDVLREFSAQPLSYEVWSQDYELDVLAADCALLTYKTAHVNAQGKLEQHSLRSSLWQLTSGRWQVRFHQGTPTTPFVRAAT